MSGSVDAQQEAQMRALLHDAVDCVSARGDLFDRVRVGAARRRRSHVAGGALAVAAVVGIGVGGAFTFGSPGASNRVTVSPVVTPPPLDLATVSPGVSSQAQGPGTAALSCPATITVAPMPSGRAGTDHTMVPGTPVEALVCTFSVTQPNSPTARTAASTLLGSRMLTGSPLQAVASVLEKPVVATIPCPLVLHYDEVLLEFRYVQGPDVAVTFSAGCPNVYNGTLAGALITTPTGAYDSVSLPAALAALLPN
jgi:hypothetical protein